MDTQVVTNETETAVEEKAEEVSKKEKKEKKTTFSLAPYFEDAKVICACGNTFTTGSTKEEIHVEICSNCHPFYTGQEKFVDTEGRVERFQRLTQAKKEPKAKKESERKAEQPKTLKEMLQSLESK